MKGFIQRFADKITGVLSGFDRLVLRGTLRPIAYARGDEGFSMAQADPAQRLCAFC
jgi:hypothetical protein